MTDRQINVTIAGDRASLAVADFRALLTQRERRALDVFEARCGVFGDRERRQVPLGKPEIRDSGDPDVKFTVKGHAAIFNRKSLDLGGFQEKIDTGAFADVLDSNPDTHLLWDHSTVLALARTLSSKYLLELREDPRGLVYFAKVAPTSFAADLRILMEGGVIDQASFAFDVESDTWEFVNRDKPNEYLLRTIHKVSALYDVTITAQGAYPQTDSQIVRAYAFNYALTNGRLADDERASSHEDLNEVREGMGLPPIEGGADPDQPAPSSPDVETPETPAPDPEQVREQIGSDDVATSTPDEGDLAGTEETPSRAAAGGDSQPNPVLRAARFHARQTLDHHRFLLENADEQT